MYGSRRTTLPSRTGQQARTEGHVVFIDRPALRKRPLDLSPLRNGHSLPSDNSIGLADLPGIFAQGDGFLRWLFKRTGLDAAAYNPQTLVRRTPACLRFLKVATPYQARQLLESEPELISPALNMLLIGVSSFFRDQAVFDVLERQILPTLAELRRPLRIWSAACADGQELYSVAMLAAESNLLRWCELVGSDCRPEATYRARLGLYDNHALREMPFSRRDRFFARETDGWRIAETIRKSVQWRTGDVMTCPEPGQWDLVLCRNMAMYLKSTATGKLWQHLERCLRIGGYLITGKAERPIGTLRLTKVAPCVYRKEWA